MSVYSFLFFTQVINILYFNLYCQMERKCYDECFQVSFCVADYVKSSKYKTYL